MGRRIGRKKEERDDRRKRKLIAAFCSAINDDEGPEGREIFRWLREDVPLSSFSFLAARIRSLRRGHTPSSFPISTTFFKS